MMESYIYVFKTNVSFVDPFGKDFYPSDEQSKLARDAVKAFEVNLARWMGLDYVLRTEIRLIGWSMLWIQVDTAYSCPTVSDFETMITALNKEFKAWANQLSKLKIVDNGIIFYCVPHYPPFIECDTTGGRK